MWLPQNISSNIAETMLVDAVRTFSQSMEQAVDNAIAFAEKEASSQGSQAPLEALRSKDGAAVHAILRLRQGDVARALRSRLHACCVAVCYHK